MIFSRWLNDSKREYVRWYVGQLRDIFGRRVISAPAQPHYSPLPAHWAVPNTTPARQHHYPETIGRLSGPVLFSFFFFFKEPSK